MSAAFENTGRDADGNTNTSKLFYFTIRQSPNFIKWNTIVLLNATTRSGLVLLRDSSPGTELYFSSWDFPI